MPTQTTIQSSFAAGILSRRMRGRVDLQQYPAGAEDLTNVVVLPQGGVVKRSGTYHTAAVKSGRVRLVPFIVSSVVAYVLEFGDLYFRVYRNHAQLIAAGVPQEVTTPYLLTHLRELKFTQSADVAYIFHGSYQPRKITRSAAGVFALTPVAFENGPFDAENTGDVGASPPGASSSGTESATSTPAPTGSGAGDGNDPIGPGGGEGNAGGAEGTGGEPGGGGGGGGGMNG